MNTDPSTDSEVRELIPSLQVLNRRLAYMNLKIKKQANGLYSLHAVWQPRNRAEPEERTLLFEKTLAEAYDGAYMNMRTTLIERRSYRRQLVELGVSDPDHPPPRNPKLT